MKFFNIFSIFFSYPYPVKEYNGKFRKPISEVLILYFEVDGYR